MRRPPFKAKEDFRRYVLEQFGMEISFRKSDKVDTFESLFRDSFISKGENMTKNREIADTMFSIMKTLGYKPYDISYGNGYFIFEMGEDSVVHFKLKGVWKSWKFGMWINSENLNKTEEITEENKYDHMIVQLFCQNEDWLDKFKPSRSSLCIKLDRDQYNDLMKVSDDKKYFYQIDNMLGMIKKHPLLCYDEYCGEYIGYADYSFLWRFIKSKVVYVYWKNIKEKTICSFWLNYTKLKLQLAKHDKIIKSVRIYDFEKENEGWSTDYKYRPLPTFIDGVTQEQVADWYDKWFKRDKYGKFDYFEYAIDVSESFNHDMIKFNNDKVVGSGDEK